VEAALAHLRIQEEVVWMSSGPSKQVLPGVHGNHAADFSLKWLLMQDV
jgi:hypothetical protein